MNYELRHEVKYKNIRSSLREHIFDIWTASRSIAANYNFGAKYEKIIMMRIFLILKMVPFQFCLESALIIMKKWFCNYFLHILNYCVLVNH